MSDLLDTIDAAAASLLDAAGFSAKVEGVEPPKVDLPDRVKAFQAVVDWAKTRNALKPPERGKTQFDAIRDKVREAPKPPEPPDLIRGPPTEQTSSTHEAIVATFRSLGYVLSARALLLLALVFSFVLAVMAMISQTQFSLYILLAGSAFTVLPVAYLETRRRT